MTINNSGEIVIGNVENATDLSENSGQLSGCDIIISAEPIPGFLTYPEKIVFEIDIIDFATYIDRFESSKRSSILKRIRDCESLFSIEFQKEIIEGDFNIWLEGYKKFISTLSDGRDRIDSNWFAERSNKHIAAFIRDKTTGSIIGGGLIKILGNKLSLSYAHYEDNLKKKGGSTFLLMELYKYASRNSYKKISLGRDTNLFGGHLSIGLLEYKLSWNSKPAINDKISIKYISVRDKSNKSFKFYTINENAELILNQY